MNPPHHKIPKILSLICFNYLITLIQADMAPSYCPIEFKMAYTFDKRVPICYKLKDPEEFEEKYTDCKGNLFTSKLYHNLNMTKQNIDLWTDYKSLYPGGPFVDWSYTDSTGDLLLTTYDIRNQTTEQDDNCVVIDPRRNFTAVPCSGRHYRYCFVKPYESEDKASNDGCSDSLNNWRFRSPMSTCVTAVRAVGGGTVRANFLQAYELCAKRGVFLLHSGWRYANHPFFHIANSTIPLGMVRTQDGYVVGPEARDIIQNTKDHSSDANIYALANYQWKMVNASYIYYDVLCESPIPTNKISLVVKVDDDNKLTLTTSEYIKTEYIYCLTDSVSYYPLSVSVVRVEESNTFILQPISDGYYWCVHGDSVNYEVTESKKTLYIREKQSTHNLYSIKIKLKSNFTLDNLEKTYKMWGESLQRLVYFSTEYLRLYGQTANFEQLQFFINATKQDTIKDKIPTFSFMKIKRLNLIGGGSCLLHVQLRPGMVAAPAGVWNDVELEYMKPSYYCKRFNKGLRKIPTLPLGASTSSTGEHGCSRMSCVGDFNDGVQWLMEEDNCPIVVTTDVILEKKATLPEPPNFSTQTGKPSTTQSSSEESTESSMYRQTSNYSTITSETEDPWFTPTQGTVSTVNTPTETVITVNTPTEESSKTETPTIFPTLPSFPTRPTTPIVTTTVSAVLPPEEQLQQVISDLEDLLHSGGSVTVNDVDNAFSQVDTLLDKEDLDLPNDLLQLLDELGARTDLNGSTTSVTVRSNIALLMADATPEAPCFGLRIARREEELFYEDAFDIIDDLANSTHLMVNQSEAVVYLPASVTASNRRISFVVFRNDRAFLATENRESYQVNSRVLSVKIQNVTTFDEGEVIDIFLLPDNYDPGRNMTRSCAYWHFLDEDNGYWSQEGCTHILATEEGMLDSCRCTHLTHFAEVLIPRTVFTQWHEDILEILSIVGCSMSLFGLTMIVVTAILFRSWRRDFSNKIWLQLCISTYILIICFFLIVFIKFDGYNVGCLLVGIFLHYSVLSSFCWMLVAAFLSYRRLVLVFTRDATHRLLRASAFAWGLPCVIIGILLSVAPHSYESQFKEISPSGAFCYPSGLALWLTIYAPIASMLIVNWILFVLIVRSVFASRRIQRHGDSNEAMRCASVSFLLVFLFGLPWLFGLFATNIVLAYLFTLTSTFQGFVLFFFFVLGNKKTRDLWLNKLKIKQTRKVPVTSSTFTNKSSSSVRTGAMVGASAMEANASKPRSMSLADDSRFS